MAQAARLNLRMQKEFKLLNTDPPPGASFPSLSDASLTSIDALFQGPEGSVYANGVFRIKIQIPERYPFQPPIVTFATPIYHPNIDNGGRICLDILNLPPKGTWQPSLNISTVLTSIGLLLSEPNPDDGLMHEASREYKYNRRAFDQKARFMTEKYARAGASDEGTESKHACHSHSCPNKEHTNIEGPNASVCATEHLCPERSIGSIQEQPPDQFMGYSSNCGGSICKAPMNDCSMHNTGIGQHKEANIISDNRAGNSDRLKATRNKLSLHTSVVSHGQNGKNLSLDMPNQCSFGLKNRTLSSGGKGLKTFTGSSTDMRLKKAGLAGLKSSSGVLVNSHQHSESEKENMQPVQYCPPQPNNESVAYHRAGKQVVIEGLKLSETVEELLPKKPGGKVPGRGSGIALNYKNASSPHGKVLQVRNGIRSDYRQPLDGDFDEESSGKLSTENTVRPEAAIVLDSEDSEDDNAPAMRSKLSLAKRCLARKRKSSY